MSAPRKFDHEDAARRYAAGEPLADLAAEYGVTYNAVRNAVRMFDPTYRAATNLYSKLYQQRAYRRPCSRGCGRLAWHNGDREGVCPSCRGAERTVTVRETELRCSECREWKPDAEFPYQRAKTARRHHHGVCRSCQTIARRRTRARSKVAA